MEKRKPSPQRHLDLHDPKLPVVHSTPNSGLLIQQIHPNPIPQIPPLE